VIVAVVFYLLWLALAFGLRTLVLLRRTGDSGFRSHPGSPEWWAGVLFVVALAAAPAAPVSNR
jgi:hypothetical protein